MGENANFQLFSSRPHVHIKKLWLKAVISLCSGGNWTPRGGGQALNRVTQQVWLKSDTSTGTCCPLDHTLPTLQSHGQRSHRTVISIPQPWSPELLKGNSHAHSSRQFWPQNKGMGSNADLGGGKCLCSVHRRKEGKGETEAGIPTHMGMHMRICM